MADRGASRPIRNESRIGTRRSGAGNGIFMIDCPSGSVSILAMQDSGGTTRYLWADTTGDWRTASAIPSNPNSDGTVVGSQS